MIKCKLRLENVVPIIYGGAKAIFRCEYDPKLIAEDVSFSKATPQGIAEFIFDNPKASEQLKIGQTYYFVISETGDSGLKEVF